MNFEAITQSRAAFQTGIITRCSMRDKVQIACVPKCSDSTPMVIIQFWKSSQMDRFIIMMLSSFYIRLSHLHRKLKVNTLCECRTREVLSNQSHELYFLVCDLICETRC